MRSVNRNITGRFLAPLGSVTPMGRKVDAGELVGAAEIAKRLGVGKGSVVSDWRQRHADFPAPVARLAMGHVWYWPDVAAWARRSGRMR